MDSMCIMLVDAQRVQRRRGAVAAQIQHKSGKVRVGLGEALGRHAQVLARTEESMEEEDGALLSLWRFLGNFTARYPLMV